MSAQGGPRGGQQSSNTPSTSWADEVSDLQEQHVPVGGFNAAEAKAALRRGTLSVCRALKLLLIFVSFTTAPGGMRTSFARLYPAILFPNE